MSNININVDLELRDLDGNILKDRVQHDDKGAIISGIAMTLGYVAAEALMAVFKDEQDLSGDEKLKRFLLAAKMRRCKDGVPIALTAEEIVLAKKCIGKAYPPLVVGQAFLILNGDSLPY